MNFEDFKEAIGANDRSAITNAIAEISKAINGRTDDNIVLTEEERARAREIAEQAKALRIQEFTGGDAAAAAADRVPEPHHLAAFSLARALAANDRDAKNDFEDPQLRSAYQSERSFTERNLSEASRATIDRHGFLAQYIVDDEIDYAAAAAALKSQLEQDLQGGGDVRLDVNGEVRKVVGLEEIDGEQMFVTEDDQRWSIDQWARSGNQVAKEQSQEARNEIEGESAELVRTPAAAAVLEIDEVTSRRLAAARGRDRESAYQALGAPDESFISSLDSRMEKANLEELGWRDRHDIDDVMQDLERLAANNWEAAANLWQKYRPDDIDKPIFIDGDDVDYPEEGRGGSNQVDKEASKGDAGRADDRDDDRVVTPESLRKRYLQAESKFFYRNGDNEGELAFEDKGKRIATEHNDPAVARSMVELAEAKHWSSLKVKGSEEFRREVWLQASLRGMQVQGYQPRDVDLARLKDLQAEEGREKGKNVIERGPALALAARAAPAAPAVAVDPETVVDESHAGMSKQQLAAIETIKAVMRERGDSDKAVNMAADIAAQRFLTDRVYVGTVLEHGAARYEHNPEKDESYYIKLQTAAGERTVWGVDLPRALEEGEADVGQPIALAYQGNKMVTIRVKERDEAGNVTGEKEMSVKRNAWDVRKLDAVRTEALEKLQAKGDRQPLVKVYDRDAPRTAARPEQVRVRQQDRDKTADLGR